MAARQLERLQGLLAVAYAPVAELGADLFPDCLSHFVVLAPLPDAGRPGAAARGLAGVHGPGLNRPHPARRARRRAGALAAAGTQPAASVDRGGQRAGVRGRLDAVRLRLRRAGRAGLLEVETAASPASAGLAGQGAGDRSSSGGRARSYALSLDGEAAIVVDPVGTEASALREHAVVLRSGRNR